MKNLKLLLFIFLTIGMGCNYPKSSNSNGKLYCIKCHTICEDDNSRSYECLNCHDGKPCKKAIEYYKKHNLTTYKLYLISEEPIPLK